MGLSGALLTASCSSSDNATATATAPAATGGQAPAFSQDWRHTDSLLALMGDLQGRRVADLFAGDGYYTLELLKAGAMVIAIDNDQATLDKVAALAASSGFGPDRLITRVVPSGRSGLSPGEVDRALCTRTFLTIPDAERIPYFSQVHEALGPDGQLFLVEFMQVQSPMGPPMEMRVNETQVMDELSPAGFTDVISYSQKLPYRFVIQAMELRQVPDNGEE